MTTTARRRRGLVLISLAVACGGLAASEVSDRAREVERRVGPLVPVAVAARDLPADAELGRRSVEMREVPEKFVPPDALPSVDGLEGARTAIPVSAGSYLTAAHVAGAGGGRDGGRLRPGERAVEVGVAGGAALADAAPGSRVDVVISTQAREGAGRSFVALEDVELLALGAGGGGDAAAPEEAGAAATATATATLRVTLRQAVYLSAAANFAREVRLLVRPPGDRGRAGRAAVDEAGL